MQRYMKSAMPFHGVPAPVAKQVFSTVLARHRLTGREAWETTVRALWAEATHREERYAALALAGHRLYRVHQIPPTLDLYRELVLTGAWWDLVDDIASHKVGPIVRSHSAVRLTILEWARAEDMWLRRAAIICQLGAKGDTDTDLLAACLEPNLADREFFIRKAIGWALRQHAWTDPAWVRDYVEQHDDRLSPLSRREAVKHLAPVLTVR